MSRVPLDLPSSAPTSTRLPLARQTSVPRQPSRVGVRVPCAPCPPSLLPPAAGFAPADKPGLDPLLQQPGRAEALTIGVVQDFRHLQAKFRGGYVHQLERPHRVAEPQLAGG